MKFFQKKTIYLIRHGEIAAQKDLEGNMLLYGDDVHLSETGQAQVHALGKRLLASGSVPTLIVTSPLIRACQTTEILRNLFDIRVITDDRLGEHAPKEEINKLLIHDIVSCKWRLDPEDERRGMSEIMTHMTDAVEHYTTNYPEDTVAFVSHGDSIRLCLYGLTHGKKCEIPSSEVLFQSDYLDKGEAWKIQLAPDFHFLEKEYIGRPLELWGRGERKS